MLHKNSKGVYICEFMLNGKIKSNPCSKVKQLETENKDRNTLSIEDEKKLLYTMKDTWIKNFTIIALYTGMRKSEILRLKWFDIKDDFIKVLQSKSGKAREIPIESRIKEVLKNISRNSEYLFYNEKTNKPYKDVERFKYYTKLANVNIQIHELRHTFATRLIAKGVDIVTLSYLLGHSNIETTRIYTHTNEDLKRNAIKLLE